MLTKLILTILVKYTFLQKKHNGDINAIEMEYVELEKA